MRKVILYGSGKRCRVLCRVFQELESDIEIMAILDSNPGRWKCRVEGYIVERPDIIRKFQSVFLCITVADYAIIEEIRKMLQLQYQYNLEKEIHYNQLILELYRTSLIVKQYILGRKTCKENTDTR